MARFLVLCACASYVSRAHILTSSEAGRHNLFFAAEMHNTMDRAFPLWRDAVDWKSIEWRKFTKIVVSGPQRSGTTWFAESLAKYLGYIHLDELNNRTMLHDKAGKATISVTGGNAAQVGEFANVLRSRDPFVMQRPAWSHALHTLPPHPKLLVVFLARNCLDVYRSQNRIMSDPLGESDKGWTCAFGRTTEWHWYHIDKELNAAIDDEHDMICTMKQQAYQRIQRALMDQRGINTVPVSYASSSTMGTYVPIEERDARLDPKQIATRTKTPPRLDPKQIATRTKTPSH